MNPTVAVSAGASALQFILNLIEDLRIDDGFVVLFDIVLRDLIFIDFCLFGQEVDDEGLLQECVTLVFSLERIAFTVPACHFCLPLGDGIFSSVSLVAIP